MAMAALESPSPFSFSVGILPPKKKKDSLCNVRVNYISSENLAIKLQNKDIPHNNNTDYNAYISSMLRSCWGLGLLKQIHGNIVKNGAGDKISVEVKAKIIDLYGRFGDVGYSRIFFNEMQTSNRLVWNTVIRACANNDYFEETLELFNQMQFAGIKPNKFTFPFIIKACTGLLDLQQGREIHKLVVRNGLEADGYIGPALVNMYAKCGSIEDARQVFDKIPERNLVLWASMISRYVGVGDGYSALGLFREMMHLKEIGLDFGCFAGGLRACGLTNGLLQGKSIHARVIRSGFESESSVVCALLNMYGKCGSGYLNKLFDKVPSTDLSIWNTMISTCAKNGYGLKALEFFYEMQKSGIEPSPFTFANVIPAFANLGDLEQAKWIHEWVIRRGFESNIYVGTALVDMYAKCGSVEVAREVFDKIPRRNEATWIAMIAGYKINDQAENARVLFNEMQKARVKPNTSVRFLSRNALADGDWQHFDDMTNEFSIDPTVKHYAHKVDILGNAGRFEEACDFIRKMQLEDLASVWGILLGACKRHCNTELAERVAEKLFKLEPRNPKWYQLLSDVYSAAGRMDGLVKVKKMMKERMLPKIPLRSILQVNDMVI